MSVPNTFASATSAIPLANLDADFAYYDAAFQIVGTAMEVNYTFRLEDPTDNTKKAEFVMSGITTGTTRQYTMPNASGTLATLANTSQTFLGTVIFAPSTNSATTVIGGIPQTGTITLGRSTASQTIEIATGAIASGITKTVNVGANGASGSTTNINFGSAVSGALVTQTWNAGANSMRFDSSGNLGLGVTPSAWGASTKSLSIGASGAAFIEGRTDAFRLNIGLNAYDTGSDTWKYAVGLQASLYKQIDAQHQWFNAPSGTAGAAITFTQAMTLDASGNLMVGQTSTGATNANSMYFNPTTGYGANLVISHLLATPGGREYQQYLYNGTAIGSITQNGTTGVAYNTSSDYRLKNITGPITTSGAYIDSLKPVEGTWKADGATFVGLIAHETQEVSRTAVATGTKDGDEMQGMDYSSAEIIANLIAELQSLRARVASLESK